MRRKTITERQKTKFYNDFGLRCKELRKKEGLSQEDMMSYGFSTRFYQRIEAGKPLHFDTVIRLSKAFDISLSKLLEGL